MKSKPPIFRITEHATHLELVFWVEQSANAFSLEAARELRGLVKKYRSWRRPAVVRSGHTRIFCSGGNLSDYKRMKGRAPGLKVNREIAAALDAFERWPAFKLAIVEGDVFGGGLEWLACFDVRWCTPSVLMGFWQKRIGLSFGWGGGRRWARRLPGGDATLKRLLNEQSLLSAFEAQRLGLVDRVVDDSALTLAIGEWVASVGQVVPWTASSERTVFERLWMGPVHADVLKRWRGDC